MGMMKEFQKGNSGNTELTAAYSAIAGLSEQVAQLQTQLSKVTATAATTTTTTTGGEAK